jgi:hypothetical protein
LEKLYIELKYNSLTSYLIFKASKCVIIVDEVVTAMWALCFCYNDIATFLAQLFVVDQIKKHLWPLYH